jgi:hypothetical protein
VKIDRQILAIARVAGAELLVSTDGNLRSTSKAVGLRAVHIDDLDLPDAARHSLGCRSKPQEPPATVDLLLRRPLNCRLASCAAQLADWSRPAWKASNHAGC